MTQIILNNVSIQYTTTLFQSLNITIKQGWTGISGPNGCGKTSLARFIYAALTEKDGASLSYEFSGSINGPSRISYLSQLPHPDHDKFYDFYYLGPHRNRALASRLEIQEDWMNRIENLSMGERRRLQLAMILSEDPDVLILDEPENHLDSYSRNLCIQVLKQFSGIGIIIGHSRQVMNSLCTSTLIIHKRDWHYYPLCFSQAMKQYKSEELYQLKNRDQLRKEVKQQSRLLSEYKSYASKAGAALSKSGIDRKDHDKKSAIDLARVTGADRSSSKKVALQKHRIERTQNELNHENTGSIKLGLTIKGNTSRKPVLFQKEKSRLTLHTALSLHIPEIKIGARDKILIQGKNGSGKTSLMEFIVANMKHDFLYIPQELDAVRSQAVLNDFQIKNEDEKAAIMAYFSRMGSDPHQFLMEKKGSPGELKKLMLATGFQEDWDILFLDEPANHLDIFTLDVIEEALSQFPGAIVMISHEGEYCESFIQKIWTIESDTLRIEEFTLPDSKKMEPGFELKD